MPTYKVSEVNAVLTIDSQLGKLAMQWHLYIMCTLGPANFGIILLLHRSYVLSEVDCIVMMS